MPPHARSFSTLPVSMITSRPGLCCLFLLDVTLFSASSQTQPAGWSPAFVYFPSASMIFPKASVLLLCLLLYLSFLFLTLSWLPTTVFFTWLFLTEMSFMYMKQNFHGCKKRHRISQHKRLNPDSISFREWIGSGTWDVWGRCLRAWLYQVAQAMTWRVCLFIFWLGLTSLR